MPKEERAQREWHMSQYERRQRGNALSGDGPRLPSGGNTRAGRRGSGHLAVSIGCLGGRLDKTGDTQMTASGGGEAVGKPGVAGVYTNQRLSLSTTREGLRLICRGFKPDSGNLTVRNYRGASGNVRHGENVNPPCNRKSERGNPSPKAWRVRFLSQWPYNWLNREVGRRREGGGWVRSSDEAE